MIMATRKGAEISRFVEHGIGCIVMTMNKTILQYENIYEYFVHCGVEIESLLFYTQPNNLLMYSFNIKY